MEMDAVQHDGTETVTARMLFGGVAAAVVLRGLTWAFSSLTIGPLLGVLDLLLGGRGQANGVQLVQAVLTVAAVAAGLLGAAGLRADPARFRRPVRLLSYVFVGDVVVYLAPVVLVAVINPGLSAPAWLLFAVAAAGNVALAWWAILIARRTRPL
jgi:hypothetical protein